LKIEVVEGDWRELDLSNNDFSGVLVQYPDTDGHVSDFHSLVDKAKASKVRTQAVFKLFIKQRFFL
jgi:glycine cleavage system pyridoxal-binding protein P